MGAVALAGLTVAVAQASDLDAVIGRALFRRAWIPGTASATANDGLGPLYNARACSACHQGLDGRPVAVAPDGRVTGENMVLRLSDAAGAPDPAYGRQIQTAGVPGVDPEGAVRRDAGGRYHLTEPAYGPLAPGVRVGARAAPPLRGLGRLAAVPEAAILARAAAQAGEGLRGRAHRPEGPAGPVGRFGAKATAATLEAQVETAFALDLGLSTAGRPAPGGDCTRAEAACLAAARGDGRPEIDAAIVRHLALYLASLGPPPAPEPDPAGERLFAETGCAACHRPALPSPEGPVRAFTDLLLHDLGPGLDGGATEPGITSTEWRTAPLWGLSRRLALGAGLLHDARAGSVAEAVRLHGGEAATSRRLAEALPETERARLLAYVGSL
ncbi:di-heme oxidoredictase family protein [Methylobacterium oryzisoli]|uniref:di-heme oxidoredictase family protein n=1 Tax=Methylobacterium oryzisoli TaxID=3385502 RepID=UPI003891774C